MAGKEYKIIENLKKFNIAMVGGIIAFSILSGSIKVDAKGNNLKNYRDMAEEIEYRMNLDVVDCSELTNEMLETRKGKEQIVERVIGKVKNKHKDGKVLNVPNKQYGDYISYKGVKKSAFGKVSKGDVIVTYLYYNTESNAWDDIVKRKDYIIVDR